MQAHSPEVSNEENTVCVKDIAAHCQSYKGADTKRSILQLSITLVLFAMMLALMLYSLNISYWITLALTLPAAGLLTRIFIFQHDCGHQSFFNSKKANDRVGRVMGILTFTPYDFWRRAHNMHHAVSGDLDRRSIGAIDTITVSEYKNLSEKNKFLYRFYRNPFVLLIFGTPFFTLVLQRFAFKQTTSFHDNYQTLSPDSIKKSVVTTNIALLAFYGVLGSIVGFGALIAVYLPILVATTWAGGWLFFVQHQFEDTYWEKNDNWSTQESALMGSSFYDLPKILQWFTGNIGLHHIHHLCSKIPNYKLQECMNAKPELATINRLTLKDSLKSLSLRLWDEQKGKLVSFKQAEMA